MKERVVLVMAGNLIPEKSIILMRASNPTRKKSAATAPVEQLPFLMIILNQVTETSHVTTIRNTKKRSAVTKMRAVHVIVENLTRQIGTPLITVLNLETQNAVPVMNT